MTAPREVAGGFSRRAVAWIMGLGVTSFALAILLSAFSEDLWERPTPHANSFSWSALGHRGLADLLRSLGVGVISRRTAGAGDAGIGRPLIAAEPDLARLAEDGRSLAALRDEAAGRDAALVVVLPKWQGEPHASDPRWLGDVDTLPAAEVGRVLAALAAPELAGAEVVRAGGPRLHGCSARWRSTSAVDFRVDLAPAQLLVPRPGLEPEVVCDGRLLVARHQPTEESPEVYLIADPDLLNNHGLGRGDNAALVVELLTHRLGAKGVVLDEVIHGFRRAPGLLAEALRFPLLLAVLQGLVLAGLLLWAGMGRFGKPLPAPRGPGDGKQVLIDNTARLLTHGGHSAESLARYVRQTVRALAAHFAFPPDLPEAEALARLQRLSGQRRLGMDLALLEAQVAAAPTGEVAAHWTLSLAQDLHRWRQEMTDGQRTDP